MAWKSLSLLRPRHWVKNLVVMLPLFTSQHAGSASAWALAAAALAAFCLGSSAVYVFNDLCDRRADRLHPAKKDRPLASGAVSARAAGALVAGLVAAALAVAACAGGGVLLVLMGYLALQAAYSLFLKHKMIADVICIALGFVLRAVAGAVGIHVDVSPWLFSCMFTLCLFMGFCKRSNELATLGDGPSAQGHRHTLAGYTTELLTHLITLSAAIAVIAFLTYATSAQTIDRFKTDYLVYTLPLFVYGVCRFAMLSMRGTYTDPVDLMLRDRPFAGTVILWLAAAGLIATYGPDIQWFLHHRGK
jgi:4-hydroxybenzoate polyprenyltransferase